MHIILKRNIEELTKDYSLEAYDESKKFEYFCNFCVTSKRYLGRFNPKDVTTAEDDAAIDGISIIIDGELATTEEDAIKLFSTHKTNLPVEIIFNQVKSGISFKKDEINNYKVGVEDFLSLDPHLPQGKFNKNALKILNVILDNLKKVRNRRPTAHFYYCTSGTYKAEREISAAFDILKRYAKEADIFYDVTVTPLGRGELLKYWADISEKNEAKLKIIDYFGMPKMPDIPQSYVGIVNAKEFVDKLLLDEAKNIKHSVFEENIRAFLGEENDVNSNIKETLSDAAKKKLFSVLNNGITIVAPEITLTPNSKEIDLTNYQIINGCQTSNTLFSCYEQLNDDVNVMVRFIESPKNEVSTDIIAATNSQTEINNESFHGLKRKAKLVQKYFDAKNSDATQENRVYFERRENEYKEFGHQATRIFDVRESARAYAAMFLNQPHNSARYVKTIFTVSGSSLFNEEDSESLYYCSVLTLYKYNTLINGRKLDAHNYNKLRRHIIQLFKWVAHGKIEDINPSSKKAEPYAEKIIRLLHSSDKKYIEKFETCQKIIDATGTPSDDSLKRGKYTLDLMEKAKELL